MKLKCLSYWLVLICALCAGYNVSAQVGHEGVIEVDGVTMTADGRIAPNVTILVKNKDRGVESQNSGVFSFVCDRGDTLQFTCLGFRAAEFVIPKDTKGEFISHVQLMVQDTFYLPETIIRPLPTREQFAYAFLHWRIPSDQFELARRNTNSYALRALGRTLPISGPEAQSRLLEQQAKQAVYYGQQQPMDILNPIKWGQFFEAWKRGDFRNDSSPYGNSTY